MDQERGGGQRSRRASSKRSFVLGLTESQTPTWFNVSECSVPAQSHILILADLCNSLSLLWNLDLCASKSH